MKIFGLFDHDIIQTLPWLTGFLWAAGGGGQKWMRRFGVPISITACAMAYGMTAVQTLWLLPFSILMAKGPGYGDDWKKRLGDLYWPYVFFLGTVWGLSQFGLCFVFGRWGRLLFGSLVSGAVFGSTMAISKRTGFWWKVCEGLTGSAVGLAAVLIIH